MPKHKPKRRSSASSASASTNKHAQVHIRNFREQKEYKFPEAAKNDPDLKFLIPTEADSKSFDAPALNFINTYMAAKVFLAPNNTEFTKTLAPHIDKKGQLSVTEFKKAGDILAARWQQHELLVKNLGILKNKELLKVANTKLGRFFSAIADFNLDSLNRIDFKSLKTDVQSIGKQYAAITAKGNRDTNYELPGIRNFIQTADGYLRISKYMNLPRFNGYDAKMDKSNRATLKNKMSTLCKHEAVNFVIGAKELMSKLLVFINKVEAHTKLLRNDRAPETVERKSPETVERKSAEPVERKSAESTTVESKNTPPRSPDNKLSDNDLDNEMEQDLDQEFTRLYKEKIHSSWYYYLTRSSWNQPQTGGAESKLVASASADIESKNSGCFGGLFLRCFGYKNNATRPGQRSPKPLSIREAIEARINACKAMDNSWFYMGYSRKRSANVIEKMMPGTTLSSESKTEDVMRKLIAQRKKKSPSI